MVGIVGLISTLIPIALHLLCKALRVLLGALLDLLAFRLDVVLKLIGIPLVVWLDYIVLPVILDQVLEILAVSWCRIWNVVVG